MSVVDITDTQGVLVKLNELNSLLTERNKIQNYLQEENDNSTYSNALYDEYCSRHTGLTDIPSVYRNFPQFPYDKSKLEQLEAEAQKASKINKLLLGAIVGCAILSLMLDVFGALLVVVIVGSIVVWGMNSSKKSNYEKAKQEYELSVERYNTTCSAFRRALSVYSQEKEKGIQSAVRYGQYYRQLYDECSDKLDKLDENLEAMKNLMDEMSLAIISEYDFITEKYHHLVPDIIDILKNYRAETYKDALNLAIADEEAEKKRQFEEQQAYERQLREEELARQQMMQIEEMRRHNAEMERQQAVANELAVQAQREAERQRRADERAQREAFSQAASAEREASRQQNQNKAAGIAKCASCANSSRCPSHVKNNGSGLTCGGYRPYGT